MEPNVASPIDPSPPVPDDRPPQLCTNILEAAGAPELGIPTAALRMSRFPKSLFASPPNVEAVPTEGIFEPIAVPADGYLIISGAVSGTASHFTLSRDAGQNFMDLNGGANLALGALYEEVVHVTKGRQITVSVSTATTVVSLDVLFVADA